MKMSLLLSGVKRSFWSTTFIFPDAS